MPSAAVAGLYRSHSSMSYQDLHNTEIKQLCGVLRINNDADYWKQVKKAIHGLPPQLRSSTIKDKLTYLHPDSRNGQPKSAKLCSGHTGLNVAIITSLWDTLRDDIDHGVGRFLYPIIMHAGLPSKQELAIRQIEVVGRMFHRDFNIEDNTPPNRDPIDAFGIDERDGSKHEIWYYQTNGCAACMLSRIGDNKEVLYALLSATVGRYSSRHIGRKGDIKSRRVRFLRYWLKQLPNGDKIADEAWDFGQELRRVRKEWKDHVRAAEKVQEKRHGFYGRQKEVYLKSPTGTAFSGTTIVSPTGVAFGNSHLNSPVGSLFPGSPTTIRPGTGRPDTAQSGCIIVGLDISEPFHPGHQSPRPNAGPRLDISEPFHPGHQTPRPNTGNGHRMTVGLDSPPFTPVYRLDPNNPLDQDRIHLSSPPNHGTDPYSSPQSPYQGGEVPHHKPMPYRAPSIHSQAASIANTADYDWDDESNSVYSGVSGSLPNYYRHPSRRDSFVRDSLMPSPLNVVKRPSGEIEIADLPRPNRKSIYAGGDRYDISPPDSPVKSPDGDGKRDTTWGGLYD